MKLLLIRHAQSIDDQQSKSQRNTSPLSDLGKKQAQEAAHVVRDYHPAAIYASPYARTQETASILFPSYAIKTLDFVYEIKRPSHLDGGSHSDAVHFWEVSHKKDKYNPAWTYDNSESFNDVVVRAKQLVDYLYENHDEEDIIAVVSHAGYIRHVVAWAGLANRYDPHIFFDFFLLFQIANAGILEVNLTQGKLTSWKQK